MDKKVCEQRRWPARAAFLRTALISGPGDVEMRPFEPLGELAQECRSRNCTTLAPTDIREIREVALQLFGVLLGEGHLPCLVIRAYACLHELMYEIFVIAHGTRVMMPQCEDARTGQCRNIYDHGGIEAPRVVKRVTEDEPAFRIGVENLDCHAGSAGGDIARFDGPAAGHVFDRGNES